MNAKKTQLKILQRAEAFVSDLIAANLYASCGFVRIRAGKRTWLTFTFSLIDKPNHDFK